MITEDYVSFEIAKLLKEKGFEGNSIFTIYDENAANAYIKELQEKHLPYSSDDPKLKEFYYTKPTLQMARRWLTTVHNLFITFELDFSDGAYPMFDAVVYNLATCKKYPIINYDRYSYIKGTEAAIKYCLKNLI